MASKQSARNWRVILGAMVPPLGLLYALLAGNSACVNLREAALAREATTVTCLFSEGGYYETFGGQLAEYLELVLDEKYPGRFKILQSSQDPATNEELKGALHILSTVADASRKGDCYLGLTQSDVAFSFVNGDHPLFPTPHRNRGRVVSFGPAQEEYFFVSTSAAHPGGYNRQDWDRLFLGEVGTGSLFTALNILPILGESPEELIQESARVHRRGVTPLDCEDEERSWAWTFVEAEDAQNHRAESREKYGGQIHSLSSVELQHITSAYSDFYGSGRLEDGLQTIKIPTLLVGSQTLPFEVAQAVEQFLNEPGTASAGSRAHSFGSLIFPPHQALTVPDYRKSRVEIAWLFGITLLLSLVAIFPRVFLLGVPQVVTAPLCKFLLYFVWILWFLFEGCQLEYHAYVSYATQSMSPLLQSSFVELLWKFPKLLTSPFSASSSLTPTYFWGRFYWIGMPIFAFLGLKPTAKAVYAPIAGSIRRYIQDKNMSEHIVICNWHEHVESIAPHLLGQAELHKRSERIAVLVDHLAKVKLPWAQSKARSAEQCGFDVPGDHHVYAFEGEIDKLIEREKVWNARVVIVFPNLTDGVEAGRYRALLTLTRIEQLIKQNGDPSREPPWVIAWCADAKEKTLFESHTGVSEVCSPTEWGWKLICQATQVRHVSELYNHMLTSSKTTNEFYELEVPSATAPMIFKDMQARFQAYNDTIDNPSRREGGAKLNTALLVGFARKDDSNRKSLQLNPRPNAQVRPGDSLIFITYRFDDEMEERLSKTLFA